MRRGAPLALALGAALLTGCNGEPTGEVSGTVTVKGKAPQVPGLAITFMSTTGKVVSTGVAPDGTYTVTGVPSGPVKVGFAISGAGDEAAAKAGKPSRDDDPSKADPKALHAREKAHIGSLRGGTSPHAPFPERFLDPLKSGLSTTVNAGEKSTFNVDIK